MNYKWKRSIAALILGVLSTVNLGAMAPAQAQQQVNPPAQEETSQDERLVEQRYMYGAGLLQRLLFAGMTNGPKAVLPTFNQFCMSDYISHAINKLLGISSSGFAHEAISTGVNHLSHGVLSYSQIQDQNMSLSTFVMKNVLPYFVRSLAINYVHDTVTNAMAIDYPNSLKGSFLFSFFVAPFISSTLKELIWGTIYDKAAASLVG